MIDVNIKGVLYGIAAALPVFRRRPSRAPLHSPLSSRPMSMWARSLFRPLRKA